MNIILYLYTSMSHVIKVRKKGEYFDHFIIHKDAAAPHLFFFRYPTISMNSLLSRSFSL